MGEDKAPRSSLLVAIQESDDIGPYKDWPQLAGYFDGDGSITIRRTSRGRPFTLLPALEFADMSRRQIKMVKEFLLSRGIRTGAMAKRNGA
jgi:LAGLIDADG-like domain